MVSSWFSKDCYTVHAGYAKIEIMKKKASQLWNNLLIKTPLVNMSKEYKKKKNSYLGSFAQNINKEIKSFDFG